MQVPWSEGLAALAHRHGPSIAVRDASTTLSYDSLSARAHALAARLREFGIAPGTPVATSLENGTDAVWASYGITVHGGAETPLHPALTAGEVRWHAGLARLQWVVTRSARRDFFAALGLQAIAIEDVGAAGDAPLAGIDGALRGRLLQTSGTTGRPKALFYSHERRALGHALLKSALPFQPAPGEALLLMTPFPHGAGLLTYAWLDFGGEVVLQDGIRRELVLAALERGVAAVFAPPTVINKLAELFPERRFPGVRCVFTGTQTLTQAGYRRAERMFGPVVRVTYGKTECINPITVLQPAETARVYDQEKRPDAACLGTPAEGVELEIRDGEIWLRARHMANGWIDSAGEHEFADGWHATGDAGWIDERGRLWLAGRLADIIKTGGYKVQPEEIEALLAGLPGCGQIVVTALPSDYWGEVVVAAAENASAGWSAAATRMVAELSRYKQPRAWVALEALPRNPQGKVNRRDVRAAILKRYVLKDGPRPELIAR